MERIVTEYAGFSAEDISLERYMARKRLEKRPGRGNRNGHFTKRLAARKTR